MDHVVSTLSRSISMFASTYCDGSNVLDSYPPGPRRQSIAVACKWAHFRFTPGMLGIHLLPGRLLEALGALRALRPLRAPLELQCQEGNPDCRKRIEASPQGPNHLKQGTWADLLVFSVHGWYSGIEMAQPNSSENLTILSSHIVNRHDSLLCLRAHWTLRLEAAVQHRTCQLLPGHRIMPCSL